MVKTLVLSKHHKIGFISENDKTITDLIIEKGLYQIGDIYIGLVQTVLASINAAFIALDSSKISGFIHVNNLGHLRQSNDSMNISDHLHSGSFVMVQILKGPKGRKGPTLTGNIIIKGRYLTLVPFGHKVTFSKNFVHTEETFYLKALISLLKPEFVGIFFHKSVLGSNLESVIQDFYSLLYQWDVICKNIGFNISPSLISSQENFTLNFLQKYYTNKTNTIVIDSCDQSRIISSIINKWKYKENLIVSIKYFSNYDFFIRKYNLDLLIYDLLQSRINLYGGAYIIIEGTEALTTIDVNSGSFNHFNNPRETILLVNKRAAKQIAKHIRLRNISGAIVIDFIDMIYQQDQLELLIYFDSLLKQDEKQPKIIQFSELGLVELTRKRQNKSLAENFFIKINKISSLNYITCTLSPFSLAHTLFLENYLIYSL